MGSKEKVVSYNCIDVSGDNYPCGIMENNEYGSTDNESSLGLEEESNELSGDLARCWEVE